MCTDQQRRVPAVTIVVLLFISCVAASHYWAAHQFPTLAGLVKIKPSLVFLEIPVQLPIPIDLVLTLILFLVSYTIVTLFFPGSPGLPFGWQTFKRLKAAVAGIIALLFCTIAGGVIYYFVQGHLSPRAQQGINTLGLNADIRFGSQNFSLQGSMIVFAGFLIGLIIFIVKIRNAPPVPLTREQRITPYERMLQEKRMHKTQPTNAYIQSKPVNIQRSSTHVCYTHPVITLKPLAVNYMPM